MANKDNIVVDLRKNNAGPIEPGKPVSFAVPKNAIRPSALSNTGSQALGSSTNTNQSGPEVRDQNASDTVESEGLADNTQEEQDTEQEPQEPEEEQEEDEDRDDDRDQDRDRDKKDDKDKEEDQEEEKNEEEGNGEEEEPQNEEGTEEEPAGEETPEGEGGGEAEGAPEGEAAAPESAPEASAGEAGAGETGVGAEGAGATEGATDAASTGTAGAAETAGATGAESAAAGAAETGAAGAAEAGTAGAVEAGAAGAEAAAAGSAAAGTGAAAGTAAAGTAGAAAAGTGAAAGAAGVAATAAGAEAAAAGTVATAGGIAAGGWVVILVVIAIILIVIIVLAVISIFHRSGSNTEVPQNKENIDYITSSVSSNKLSFVTTGDLEQIQKGNISTPSLQAITLLTKKHESVKINYSLDEKTSTTATSADSSLRSNAPFELDVAALDKIKCTDTKNGNAKAAEFDISLVAKFNWNDYLSGKDGLLCAVGYYPKIEIKVTSAALDSYGPGEFLINEIAAMGPKAAKAKAVEAANEIIANHNNFMIDPADKTSIVPTIVKMPLSESDPAFIELKNRVSAANADSGEKAKTYIVSDMEMPYILHIGFFDEPTDTDYSKYTEEDFNNKLEAKINANQ